MARKNSRIWMTVAAAGLVGLGLAWAFWPRTVLVDTGQVQRAPMVMVINERARTRVRDAYVVSAPIAGRLLRVQVEPGDAVEGGVSVIAHMLPTNPAALDVRTREQAIAAVSAAEAQLRVARADLGRTNADLELADLELKRTRQLIERGTVAQAVLDRAESLFRTRSAARDMAEAAIAMREADLANTRARLIDYTERTDPGSGPPLVQQAIPLHAPVDGRVLQVIQVSETILQAGEPILEIGDISRDLEIVAELLSSDAVQVRKGDRVEIDNWGGGRVLAGLVERVEPWGFTKFSALGVEEQRVNAIIRLAEAGDGYDGLGHGFRVDVHIVVWEEKDALTLPSSALFRHDGGWAVFAVRDGRAEQVGVRIGRNNGLLAEVRDGPQAGEAVVLYPGPSLTAGTRVAQRQTSSGS